MKTLLRLFFFCSFLHIVLLAEAQKLNTNEITILKQDTITGELTPVTIDTVTGVITHPITNSPNVTANKKSFNTQSGFAVAADKMNVLYVGVDNPISIAVAGIPDDKISTIINNGTIEGKNGKYIAKVNKSGTAIIEVFSEANNKKKSIGKTEFRVKNVPNPVPEFMGKRGTETMSLAQLKAGEMVMAKLDNFEFNISFPVVSFSLIINDFVIIPKGSHLMKQDPTTGELTPTVTAVDSLVESKIIETSSSGMLTKQQKALIAKTKVGDNVLISIVKVKKPNGDVVDIGSINLKVIQ